MSRRDFVSVHDMSMDEIEKRLEDIERNKVEFYAEARDGFYISTREGQFLDCNDALVKMLGYRATEDVLCLDLNTELWADPEERPRFQAIIERQGFVRDYQGTFRSKDGQVIYVSLSSHVWRDRLGKVGGYRGFVVDRTREKLMSDQLQILETRYKNLFGNIRDGVFISDAEGTVIDCNEALCEIVGRTRAEFMGMNYYKDLFVNPEAVLDFRRKFTNYGEVNDYELQLVRKDGTIRDIAMSGYATRNAEGEIMSYQGLMRDITEAKRLRRQLIQSERLSAMGKMALQLAHELNNPIYGIMNCLELVKGVVPPANEKRKFLDLAYNECKRTSGLLIKMLKFFRPDDEKKSPTDINKLIEETLLFYEKQLKNLNINVTTELSPDLPEFPAVENQLKQVFINMIINANTAMPSGGDLRVTSRFDRGRRRILVTIEDTGVGIPPENLERIFDAFFTTKNEVKGVGLGLSICYGFIKEHGGEIDVASEVGKGTVFTISLPVTPHAN
ncbi:MAG: PAS domain S-box protein [Desulfomonile tiedjei]|nr:PAS domain S-box protein [Desulfomonile tiedjei]